MVVLSALVAANQAPPTPAGGARANTPTPARPPTGTAIVSGQVVNPDGGHPIRRSMVRLASVTPEVSRTAMSDDMGNFQFKDLPAGQFTLSAWKAGYLDATYGQKKPGDGRTGTPLSVADGQRLEHLALPMPRGGVISGTVVDDVSEPAFLTVVRAMRYVWRAGERTLTMAGSATANDRGVYRIPVLPAGDYIIMATPLSELPVASLRLAASSFVAGRNSGGAFAMPFLNGVPGQAGQTPGNAPATGYAPVYFPTTTVASAATPVSLGVSEERSGIDLQLQLVPMGRITGTITGADQNVIGRTTVTLTDTQGLPGMNTKTAPVGPDGSFSFPGVAPGQYRISARSAAPVIIRTVTEGQPVTVWTGIGRGRSAGPPPPPSMWAQADLAIDGTQPTTVSLALQPGMTIGGKLAFDGAAPAPTDLTQIRVVLSPADANDKDSAATDQSDAGGQFKLSGVPPGKYRMSLLGTHNWHAQSAAVAGRDALDFPIDVRPGEDIANAIITLTDRVSEISGTLQDSLGRPTAGYTLIVFADDERYWTAQSRRIMATKPASDGKFSFANLPAGGYRLVAVSDVEEGQWFDPALLRQLSGAAMSLKLASGERKTQDVRVAK